MRKRQRSQTGTKSPARSRWRTWDNYGNLVYDPGWSDYGLRSNSWATIVDYVGGKQGPDGLYPERPVHHTTGKVFGGGTADYRFTHANGWSISWELAPPVLFPPATAFDSVRPSATELNNAHFEALSSFAGQVKPELDVPNFIRESTDLKRSLDFLKSKSLFKSLAQSALAYSFGIVPLLSDLFGIYDQVVGVNKKIDWYRKNSEKWVSYHYRQTLPLEGVVWTGFPSTGTGTDWRVKTTESSCWYHCGADVRWKFDGLDTAANYARAVIGATGFGNPYSVAWNAIPFSFVLDWVSNVGDLIGAIDRPEWPWKFQVRRATYSVKTVWNYTQYRAYNVSGGGTYTPVCSGTDTRYDRKLGLPVSVLLMPTVEIPNWRELALAFALITANL